jgi:glycerophosphoryl diester phosphodiesterase
MQENPLLDPDAHPVIGHRGAAAHAPENTLPSFRRAIELGAEALELDVQLARDGAVMVFHDPTLDRTTDAIGPIGARTRAELRTVDAGARWTADGGRSFPWRGRSVGISTLDELLEEVRDLPLIIEAKSYVVAAPLARVLERHAAQARVLVGSLVGRNLVPFAGAGWRRIATQAQSVALLASAIVTWPWGSLPYAALAIPPVFGRLPLPIRRLARAARRRGRPLHVWTVNDEATARRLWSAGVNGLIGDDPALLLRVRAAMRERGLLA